MFNFMTRLLFIIFFLLFSINLEAKTEIDKAFIKRTGNIKNQKFLAYSPDIYEGREIRNNQVYNKYGCRGNNVSPQITWKNEPKNTKSFAITMYTKDANSGSGWWHWIIYNIPQNINVLLAGASNNKSLLPKGAVQGMNDYGENQYGGVCPPLNNKYEYTITVYALDIEELDLPKNSTPAMVVLNLNNHKIATTQIKSSYTGKDESTLFINNDKSKKYIAKLNTKQNTEDSKKILNNKTNTKNTQNKYIFTGTKKQNKTQTSTTKKVVQKKEFIFKQQATTPIQQNKKMVIKNKNTLNTNVQTKTKTYTLSKQINSNVKNTLSTSTKPMKKTQVKTESITKNKSGKIKEYDLKS